VSLESASEKEKIILKSLQKVIEDMGKVDNIRGSVPMKNKKKKKGKK
jgi:hypothetical protein